MGTTHDDLYPSPPLAERDAGDFALWAYCMRLELEERIARLTDGANADPRRAQDVAAEVAALTRGVASMRDMEGAALVAERDLNAVLEALAADTEGERAQPSMTYVVPPRPVALVPVEVVDRSVTVLRGELSRDDLFGLASTIVTSARHAADRGIGRGVRLGIECPACAQGEVAIGLHGMAIACACSAETVFAGLRDLAEEFGPEAIADVDRIIARLRPADPSPPSPEAS